MSEAIDAVEELFASRFFCVAADDSLTTRYSEEKQGRDKASCAGGLGVWRGR